MIERNSSVEWPPKYDLLGVQVSAVNYEQAVAATVAAARQRLPAVVSLQAVHAVVTAGGDAELRRKVNSFEMIGPDGQPVRWAMNLLHKTGLRDRVYGPEFMLRLCAAAEAEGLAIYLYGSTEEVLEKLQANLARRYPALRVAGAESPPFRALSDEEDEAVVRRINAGGAHLVFIGLGAPKQDEFAYDHRDRLQGVQVCVGAAFDFHAGTKSMAPAWMQRRGLEWLYRLGQEPRRLWRRYLVTNSLFVAGLARCWLGGAKPDKNGQRAGNR